MFAILDKAKPDTEYIGRLNLAAVKCSSTEQDKICCTEHGPTRGLCMFFYSVFKTKLLYILCNVYMQNCK
jgi:hypothetical protein